LKLLTGALYPTSGRLEVHGRVLSLLELGTGFNPDLTGRQNVQQSARLLGFQPGYATARVDDIEAFAELGEYFDRPVKFYSTGMLVRLAFSLFSTMQPDVFLVDEALAVGDLRFASKALGRIREMLEAGTTLLFVSHDLQLVNRICSRALWLHAGSVQMDGDPTEVTRAYQQFVVHGDVVEPALAAAPAAPETGLSLATGEARISIGSGWLDLEAYAGEVFRWASGDAEIVVSTAGAPEDELLLDLEPGPSAELPLHLAVLSDSGALLAQVDLHGREWVRVRLPRSELADPERLVLRPRGQTRPVPGDGRRLVLRAFAWAWCDPARARSIQHASEWAQPAHDLDLTSEFAHMQAALRRCAPVPGRAVRFTRILVRNTRGEAAVRFATHDAAIVELTIEALEDVDGLIVGLQLRDAFDRLLSGTRSDWQHAIVPPVRAGVALLVTFECPDLPLGPGLYQFTVGLARDRREDHICHWVDGSWRFEVFSPTSAPGVGLVDLSWRYGGSRPETAHPVERLAVRQS
jgi:ABC-type polysaccharide/polyol phosphate transport system ATPase subunit